MPSGPSYDINVKLKGSENVTRAFKSIAKEGDIVSTTMRRVDNSGKVLSESVRTVNKRTGEAETTFRRFNKTALDGHMAATRFHTGIIAAAAGVGLVAATLRGAWREFVTLAKEGAEATAAIEGVRAAFRAHGHEVENNTKAVEAFGREMQEKVATDGDRFIAMLGRMEAATGANVPTLKSMGVAAVGLAQIMKQDLDTAGQTVIRTVNGSNRAFKALGVEVQKNWTPQERLAALLAATSAGMEQATEKAKGTEGQIARLELKWGDLRERVGQVITQNPELLDSLNKLVDGPLPKMVDALAKLVNWFADLPTGMQGAAVAAAVLGPALGGVAAGFNAIAAGMARAAAVGKANPWLLSLIGLYLTGKAVGDITGQAAMNHAKAWDATQGGKNPGGQSTVRSNKGQAPIKSYGGGGSPTAAHSSPIMGGWAKNKINWFMPDTVMNSAGIMEATAGAVVNNRQRQSVSGRMGNLNKAFDADGLMSIAGSDDYMQSAFQLAGGAIGGPIGGFLGGGIARTLKGLFGGGGGKDERGLEPSKPIYTSDVQLTERITQFLNIALPMIARGGGMSIDRATGQLPTFSSSAGGVG
jgi:hypothetical protein